MTVVHTMNKFAFRMLLLALVTLSNACHTLPETVTPDTTDMRLLGRNPWAFRQRSLPGRQIQSVEYLDGQVYVGFGDWRANTGPIAVSSWDIALGAWVFHFNAGTEALERLRTTSAGLLLPYTDPLRSVDFAWGPVWQEAKASGARQESFYHVFDAAETTAGIFLVGTRRPTGEPQVLRWNGQEWSESLLLKGKPDWIWFAAVLDDVLHVQTEAQGTFRLLDGNWQQTEALFQTPRTRAVVSAGKRVAGISREITRAGHLQISNGVERSRETDATALDLNIDQASGWIYLLRGDRIERSHDLLNWQTLDVPVPESATALDIGAGHAWIGTANGALWAVKLAEE
jgi:hypothetical protein